jgi:hypothetical protein
LAFKVSTPEGWKLPDSVKLGWLGVGAGVGCSPQPLKATPIIPKTKAMVSATATPAFLLALMVACISTLLFFAAGSLFAAGDLRLDVWAFPPPRHPLL